MTLASLSQPVPVSSATRAGAWVPIPGSAEAYSSAAEGDAPWNAVLHAEPVASTEHPATSIRPAIRPWYDQAGADGMRAPVERMKRLARRLEPQALFSAPEVVSVADDDGVELTSVVVDVFIPEEADGMAFRDSFFGTLADALCTRDLGRLAVGVGRLGPLSSRASEPNTGDSTSHG